MEQSEQYGRLKPEEMVSEFAKLLRKGILKGQGIYGEDTS